MRSFHSLSTRSRPFVLPRPTDLIKGDMRPVGAIIYTQLPIIRGNQSVKKVSWNLIAETIVLVSIVGGLLLVVWQILQTNNIARAEAVMNLTEQWNEFNSSWFENPEVARLSQYVMAPDQHEISPIDQVRITGMAWHFTNIFWSAQIAYENGLLRDEDIKNYQSDLLWMIEFMPGLNAEFAHIYETSQYMHGVFIFEPIEHLLEVKASN